MRALDWSYYWCSRISLRMLLLYYMQLVTVRAELGDTIDPHRLLVTTVIDPTNSEIVRDALTLVRSIRIFGGKLNEATFRACIPIEDNSALVDGDQVSSLVEKLSNLGTEISFIPQSKFPTPKTMNKFEALQLFDPLRHDYALWLDADIVVFEDPLRGDKYLKKHRYPGSIDCVPDFYSYLRRYPQISRTDIVWNPALPALLLTGDGEIAPYATCNTGVLFFDALSLQNTLAALPGAISAVDQINPFKKDRFLDSLYFVAAVHARAIEVNILPFEFNYMAFFEREIIEEYGVVEKPIFIHFLSDTTMSCYAVSEEHRTNDADICRCNYLTSLTEIPENSVIFQKAQSVTRLETCVLLAGLAPIPDHDFSSVRRGPSRPPPPDSSLFSRNSDFTEEMSGMAAVTESKEDDMKCQLVWPPFNSSMLSIPTLNEFIKIHLVIRCEEEEESSTTTASASGAAAHGSSIYLQMDYEVDVSPIVGAPNRRYNFDCLEKDQCPPAASSSVDRSRVMTSSGTSSIQLFYRTSNITDNDDGTTAAKGGGGGGGSKEEEELERQSANNSQSEGGGAYFVDTMLQIYVAADEFVGIAGNAMITLSLRLSSSRRRDSTADSLPPGAQLTQTEQSASGASSSPETASPGVTVNAATNKVIGNAAAHILLVVESATPSGTVAYGANPLISLKPISLQSQQQLPRLLNSRRISDTGVVLCCDTVKGVDTTEGLIRDWKGQYLVVMVVSTPPPIMVDSTSSTGTRVRVSAGSAGSNDRELLTARLKSYCDDTNGKRAAESSRRLRCVIIVGTGNTALSLGAAMKQREISFMYIDAYLGHHHYMQVLSTWFPLVSNTGIIMGSRYYNSFDHTTTAELLLSVKAAVDAYSLSVLQTPLVTYAESSLSFCQYMMNLALTNMSYYHRECSPAWYFLKLPVRYL